MEESRCSAPGCGALIGGRNHTSATGTVRLGAGAQAEVPGYIQIAETDEESNLSKLVLRFLVHSSLYLSAFRPQNQKKLRKFLGLPDSETVSTWLWMRLERDYSRLKAKTSFADDDLAMALHQVFKASCGGDLLSLDLLQPQNRFLTSFFKLETLTPPRRTFETFFERNCIDPILASRRLLFILVISESQIGVWSSSKLLERKILEQPRLSSSRNAFSQTGPTSSRLGQKRRLRLSWPLRKY
jgi:hypothetical protein